MTAIRMKRYFFDRSEVINATTRAERRVMNNAGGLTRKIARQSIRKRKKISTPGQPPSSHAGHLRNLIFYFYEARQNSVVIGPEKFTNRGLNYVVPEVLEFGGRVSRRDRRRSERVSMRFQKRPYMKPALDKVAPKFPGLWKDSVRS